MISTSDQLYEAYVALREREQAIRDVCIDSGMTLEEIDADETYREAIADRERAYQNWLNAWKGYRYACPTCK